MQHHQFHMCSADGPCAEYLACCHMHKKSRSDVPFSVTRRAYPTFHIYRDGKVVGEVQGTDRGGLRRIIDSETRLLAPLNSEC